MTQEKEVPGILKKIVDKAIKERQEQASVEEAQGRVEELGSKILELLGLKIPEIEENELALEKFNTGEKLQKSDLEEMASRVAVRIRVMLEPIRKTFLVPVENEKLKVFLTKGGKSNSFTSHIDRGLEVSVEMNDSYLRINEGMAFIVSKARNLRPFDNHTPIGPGGDLGPAWSRKMNMDDFYDYNSLLDRLNEPDVERVSVKTSG